VAFGSCPDTDAPAPPAAQALINAIDALTQHISGGAQLTTDQVAQLEVTFTNNPATYAADAQTLAKAVELAHLYEDVVGPLFLNSETEGGFPRLGGLTVHRAIRAVMQSLIDGVYTNDNIERFPDIFATAKFASADYFPGKIAAGAEILQDYVTKINASQPTFPVRPVQFNELPARRPTGAYLPPGNVGVVTVPDALVNKGFAIRVGAHSWDLSSKNTISRLDRVSIVYPVTCKWTRISNPLGGAIYIEVPYEANEGIVDIEFNNIIRSPFYKARSFDAQTTNLEWETERNHPAPWADFETDKFMMQVPSPWLNLVGLATDPRALMAEWDAAMDAYSELFALPTIRSKTVLYMQIDTIFRGNANFPGYPQSNTPYDPLNIAGSTAHQWVLRSPQLGRWEHWHELGHAHFVTKFQGETESAVNLPYVAVFNRKFGVPLDLAFGQSIGPLTRYTLDLAATTWFVRPNFREGIPISAQEMQYQHRGHGKYVAIVKLFGWEALERFSQTDNDNYLNGMEPANFNNDPRDNRILRLSRSAGADLSPLLAAWGVPALNANQLAANIAAENIPSSAAIYDELQRYKTLIPMNNEEFRAHADIAFPNLTAAANTEVGVGWYFLEVDRYSDVDGQMALAYLQSIIDRYFPNGRP
jgi:hypothetical protein